MHAATLVPIISVEREPYGDVPLMLLSSDVVLASSAAVASLRASPWLLSELVHTQKCEQQKSAPPRKKVSAAAVEKCHRSQKLGTTCFQGSL